MPSRKDLKRLVRARMAKTGESYTAARAQITHQKLTLPRGYQDLAGVADPSLVEKTGKTWRQWVAVLDEIGATEMSHRDIARWLKDDAGLGSWWCQTVTVGYERIRGLRAVGQRRDGTYTASKNRTLPFPGNMVRRAIEDPELRASWLPESEVAPRGSGRSKDFRFACPDGSRGVLAVTPKGDARAVVAVGHEKLPSAEEVRRRKAFWEQHFEALRKLLASGAA
jgi:uncharacterized protein YndB with AHSA1/START domain